MSRTERKSQFDKALFGLRGLILDGEFEANTRLPEVSLADRLDISRTPLRQAMDRLVDEGLLERIETGGCRVASFSKEDIVDAIELRGVIEGTAARLAAERGAPAELLVRGEEILGELDRAVFREDGIDFATYVTANAAFHALVARLSGSTVVERESERVSRLPLASPSAFLRGQELIPDFQASLRRAQDQHRQILAAIRDRQGTRAEALCREHARLALRNLDHVMSGDRSLVDRVPGLALVSNG